MGSFRDWNLDLLTTHCSHATVAALLSGAVIQLWWHWAEPGHLALTKVLLAEVLQSLLFASWDKQHGIVLFWRGEVTKDKNLRNCNFEEPLSPLKATSGFKGIEDTLEMGAVCFQSYLTTLPNLILVGRGEREEWVWLRKRAGFWAMR